MPSNPPPLAEAVRCNSAGREVHHPFYRENQLKNVSIVGQFLLSAGFVIVCVCVWCGDVRHVGQVTRQQVSSR